MLALDSNLLNWACNLHQQDPALRIPHSGLLMTPTWKCQGLKEARKCVICPTSSKPGACICTVLCSGHPALSILPCCAQPALPPCLFGTVSRVSGAHLMQHSREVTAWRWSRPAPHQPVPPAGHTTSLCLSFLFCNKGVHLIRLVQGIESGHVCLTLRMVLGTGKELSRC